jgi:microcystin-dependent protein
VTDPFVAEVRMFGFNFVPSGGWAWCDGQLMPISQNTALFSLLGTTYGGDGKSTFALPNLRDSTPMGAYQNSDQAYPLSQHFLGEEGGSETVTLLQSEMPFHNHTAWVSGEPAVERAPGGQKFGSGDGVSMYNTNAQPTTTMDPRALSVAGGSLPHNNMQPYVGLNFCIALQGVFPPRW